MNQLKQFLIYSLVAFLMLGAASELFAQKDFSFRKTTVGLYIPINHYFDGTETNWGILVPTTIHSDSGKKVLPETIGLFLSRSLDSTRALTFSLMSYHRSYGYPRDLPFGQVVSRHFIQVGIGYSHTILFWNDLKVSALAELNHRRGYEEIHIYYPQWFEAYSEPVYLRDLGISLGLQFAQTIYKGLAFTFDAKYNQFIHLKQTQLEFNGQNTTATNRNLSFSVGLSYSFRAKIS